MSKKRRRHSARNLTATADGDKRTPSTAAKIALPLTFCAVLAAGIILFVYVPNDKGALPRRSDSPALPARAQQFKSLDELVKAKPADLGSADIAEMNMLCATGLPGSEKLDVAKCLARLDDWARRVGSETDRYMYKFLQNPKDFRDSEGYFRMLTLISVLQQDFGVHYNPDRARGIDFTKSKDLFIHGMIDDPNGGTCVSMPAIYTAVARRLGYPVRLVFTKTHLFCRWDCPRERFNIEATNQGLNCFEDEYYKHWPEKTTDAEIKANRYLVSLSPPEELAAFLACRGHCLTDNGRTVEACEAYALAHHYDQQNPAYLAWLQQTEAKLNPMASKAPSGIPEPPGVRRTDPLAEVERINAMNHANVQRTAPPKPGAPPPALPTALPPRPGPNPPQPGPERTAK